MIKDEKTTRIPSAAMFQPLAACIASIPYTYRSPKIDGFVKSPISALRAIFEESHVHISTINSSKIARAWILNFFLCRPKVTFTNAS